MKQPVESYGSDRKMAYIHGPEKRSHWTLSIEEAGELLTESVRIASPFISRVLGGNATLAELAVLSSYHGAEAQDRHVDALVASKSEDRPSQISIWVPLVDITHEMGPLHLWPGLLEYLDESQDGTGKETKTFAFLQ